MSVEVATIEPSTEAPDARRARLETTRAEMSASYDRALLTLSAGAFSLSILFSEKIAPQPLESTKPCLIAAWVSFGICLLVVLFSFFLSEKLHRKELDTMDTGGKFNARAEKRQERLNLASGVLFSSGVVLLLVYAALNLLGN